MAEPARMWYRWIRAPEDIRNAVLAFIADRQYRIAADPPPILLVHHVAVKLDVLIGDPIRKLLDEVYDAEMFVPYDDNRMIAAWCRQLGVELKDAEVI